MRPMKGVEMRYFYQVKNHIWSHPKMYAFGALLLIVYFLANSNADLDR